jgi:3-hydroxymyristoyl/3-hydroxydecanoyl-(acyl carrier protein) dehydratase
MLPTQDAVAAVHAVQVSVAGASGSGFFSADLPVFIGHFPGHPLVPGVYLLAAVAEVARQAGVAQGEVIGIERAKWSAPAYPEQDLRITLTTKAQENSWRVDGEISGPNGLCATCRLLMG